MNYIFPQILAPIKVTSDPVSINLARSITDTVNDSVDRIEMVRAEVSPQWLALSTEGYPFSLLLEWFVEILIVVPLWFRLLTTRRFYSTHRLAPTVAKDMSSLPTFPTPTTTLLLLGRVITIVSWYSPDLMSCTLLFFSANRGELHFKFFLFAQGFVLSCH